MKIEAFWKYFMFFFGNKLKGSRREKAILGASGSTSRTNVGVV